MELMRAVYKWAPLAMRRDDSLAAAQDAALDFFLLLGADPIRRAPVDWTGTCLPICITRTRKLLQG